MKPTVFDANVLIELLPNEDKKIGSLYVADADKAEKKGPEARKCKVIGVGKGYYIAEKDDYKPLPFKEGEEIMVVEGTWIDFISEGVEYHVVQANSVLALVNSTRGKGEILDFPVQ